jgi:hypothetical protein
MNFFFSLGGFFAEQFFQRRFFKHVMNGRKAAQGIGT